jgi:hypothetical protein
MNYTVKAGPTGEPKATVMATKLFHMDTCTHVMYACAQAHASMDGAGVNIYIPHMGYASTQTSYKTAWAH